MVWLPFFIFPYIGNNHPNWLIFFRGVQTTNQYQLIYFHTTSYYYHTVDGPAKSCTTKVVFHLSTQDFATIHRSSPANPTQHSIHLIYCRICMVLLYLIFTIYSSVIFDSILGLWRDEALGCLLGQIWWEHPRCRGDAEQVCGTSGIGSSW